MRETGPGRNNKKGNWKFLARKKLNLFIRASLCIYDIDIRCCDGSTIRISNKSFLFLRARCFLLLLFPLIEAKCALCCVLFKLGQNVVERTDFPHAKLNNKNLFSEIA